MIVPKSHKVYYFGIYATQLSIKSSICPSKNLLSSKYFKILQIFKIVALVIFILFKCGELHRSTKLVMLHKLLQFNAYKQSYKLVRNTTAYCSTCQKQKPISYKSHQTWKMKDTLSNTFLYMQKYEMAMTRIPFIICLKQNKVKSGKNSIHWILIISYIFQKHDCLL